VLVEKETKVINPISSFPVFIVESLDAAKAFYLNHFGFDLVFENEWYVHLVSESGVQIGFVLPNQPTQPEIFRPSYNGNGVIFSLEVENADSAYAEAKQKSLDIVLDLRSEDWGQRHFSVKDPNGIYLDIVQAIEPTEEYQQDYEA
jgi:uncharacterized glyoxalase superfamily protein PhnB